MHKLLKASLLASISMGVAAVAAPVQAQDGASAADENRIVVTARKREENLIDVPLAVTVATQEQLARDQITNVNDLQRVAPALEISQTAGGESNGGGRLRGLGTGVFNPSVAPSVALVIDQVPVGNLNFPLLYDLAQVEVLRGPQGTLFGQGASAGVLNITTRAPQFDGIGVNASLDWADKGTAGSEVGEIIANAGLNLPFSDQIALRVAGQFKRETGLQRSTTTGRDNEIEDWGIRARLRLEPADDFSLTFGFEHGENTSDGQTFFAIASAPNGTNLADPDGPGPAPQLPIGIYSTNAYTNPAGCNVTISPRAEEYCEDVPTQLATVMNAVSAVMDFEISDTLSLTSVSGFRARRFLQYSRDFSRITNSPAARQERTQEDGHGFSQELRFNYTGDTFDLVAGGFYNDFKFDRVPMGDTPYTFGSNLPGQRIGFSVCFNAGFFCPVPTSFSKETTTNRTLAAFADATLALSDQVEIFGGLRYDDYSNTTRLGTNVLSGTSTIEVSDSAISGRIGASFMPNPDMNLFASYSRGYKPPAVGTNVAGQPFRLEPETSDAFEIGAKYAVGRLQLSANAFYTELANFQSQESVFVGTALISNQINIPSLTSKGVEFNVFGQIAPGFNINAGYQFNILEYPDGFQGDDKIAGDPNSALLGGTQFLNAPKHKFTLSGDYGFPISDGLELFVNANLVYKSEVLLAARADPRYRYPAHEIINGGFGIRDADGGWTASVFVRNLTKEREPTAYLASTFAGATDGGIRAWPVAGLTARVVGVRLGVDF